MSAIIIIKLQKLLQTHRQSPWTGNASAILGWTDRWTYTTKSIISLDCNIPSYLWFASLPEVFWSLALSHNPLGIRGKLFQSGKCMDVAKDASVSDIMQAQNHECFSWVTQNVYECVRFFVCLIAFNGSDLW